MRVCERKYLRALTAVTMTGSKRPRARPGSQREGNGPGKEPRTLRNSLPRRAVPNTTSPPARAPRLWSGITLRWNTRSATTAQTTAPTEDGPKYSPFNDRATTAPRPALALSHEKLLVSPLQKAAARYTRANRMTINNDRANSNRARGKKGMTDPTSRLTAQRTPQLITIAMTTASSLLRTGFASQASKKSRNHGPQDHSPRNDDSGNIYGTRWRRIATHSRVVAEKNAESPTGKVSILQSNSPAPASIAPPASNTTCGMINLRHRSYASAPEQAAAKAAAVIG